MTLIASLEYGLYQVLYEKYLTLPSGLEHERPPQSSHAPIHRMSFDSTGDASPPTEDAISRDSQPISDATIYPPSFGLHPNLLISPVGILTLIFLWTPLPVLHYVGGAEQFYLPIDRYLVAVISGIALSSVVPIGGSMATPQFSVCTT